MKYLYKNLKSHNPQFLVNGKPSSLRSLRGLKGDMPSNNMKSYLIRNVLDIIIDFDTHNAFYINGF